jgi:REP element-mobilizing transposase RayT
MPSSWTQNYYHAVFSTRLRRALIKPECEPRIHAFVGGILRDLDCTAIAVNGMPDHIHFLARYPSKLSHADMLRHVKSRSSGWIRDTFPLLSDFAWQEGYGGFTVSKSAADDVADYIRRQKAHHAKISFEVEFLELLRRHGIEFEHGEVFH